MEECYESAVDFRLAFRYNKDSVDTLAGKMRGLDEKNKRAAGFSYRSKN